MPNVPKAPGVPALASFAVLNVILLVADSILALRGFFSTVQWGVFLSGVPVIDADNMVSFELKQDNPVSDYPVEGGRELPGGFQSYDKVQLPSTIRLTVSAGGSISNRQAFLASIDAVMNTIDVYDVITPEKAYVGYNFTHREFHRKADNVGLIAVDLWLTEIRQTATAAFSNTQQPGYAGQQSIGNVTPQTPTASISQSFASAHGAI